MRKNNLIKYWRIFMITGFILSFTLSSCSDKINNDNIDDDDKEFPLENNKTKDLEDLKTLLGATKFITNCDYDCADMYGAFKSPESVGASLEISLDNQEKQQGEGSYKLDYKFSGKDVRGNAERVFIRKTFYDLFRSDLDFHPLGISLWVKSFKNNNIAITVKLLQTNEDFNIAADNLKEFIYTDSTFLNQDGWKQLIVPYKWFVADVKNPTEKLNLKRVNGVAIELSNISKQASKGTIHIDAIEQLTSFKPEFKEPAIFSSIFVQLHNPTNANTNWLSTFKAYREVRIDTVIIQRSVNSRSGVGEFFYTGSTLPQKNVEYNMINKMFTAAESTGMKIILGLNQGVYPEDKGDINAYTTLYETNTELLDELYNIFSNSPAMAGWYIAEEFHDGQWKGWWKPSDRMVLANYLQNVASHAKTKEKKFLVAIAPALFRGRPADQTYGFYKSVFEKTPDVDILYLQDCGGRCYVDENDYDVYIPQYFEMIKKACDETGIQFGVDIESFENCACEGKNYEKRSWDKLKAQLDYSGLYTKNISQFSWSSFRPGVTSFDPGVGAFDQYREYLRSKNLLRKLD